MDASNCLVTNVLQNILFYVQHEKETQTGLEQLEGKQMTIYIVGLTMPLNILFSHLSLYFTTTLELLYYYGLKQYALEYYTHFNQCTTSPKHLHSMETSVFIFRYW